jgi:hypothetical protein
MLLFIVNLVIITFLVIEIAGANEPGCRNYGRRLAKKIQKIQWASRPDGTPIKFLSKGSEFSIRVENVKVGPGIKYETIPVYSCKDVFINDENVCKIHCLEALFGKTYVAEYSNKRHDHEIEELINTAYKTAKQLDKEYWEKYRKEHTISNSFYTDEKR